MKPIVLLTFSALLIGLSACPEQMDKFKAQRFGELVEEFKEQNGREPTEEEEAILAERADKEVEEGVKKEEGEVGEGVKQVATGVATGNILLIIMGIFGTIGGGSALYARYKKARKK